MFFDGFSDTSMRDEATTADRLSTGGQTPSWYLCNWDWRFYASANVSQDSQVYVGFNNISRIQSVAQSYRASGPFRLLSLSFAKNQSINQSHALDLSLYTAGADGAPLSKQQDLTVYPITSAANSNAVILGYEASQPVVTDSGNFSICLSAPASLYNSTSVQYAWPYISSVYDRPNLSGVWRQPSGGAWAGYGSSRAQWAITLCGSPVNEPPQWVAKEVVLSRPCSQATVFLTQDAASAGRIIPRISLFDEGETPVFLDMERELSKDLFLSGSRIETCWALIVPTPKTQAQLTIQFDGIHAGDRLYEYGCVLSERPEWMADSQAYPAMEERISELEHKIEELTEGLR
jgi:hypothetical protein